MSWNHRVVRRSFTHTNGSIECWYEIHEAYYFDDEKPAITTGSVAATGDTVEELRADLKRMLKALDKPVLDYDTREEI